MGLEYTVVKEEEIPVELKKLIEAKKANTLRMTYATKDATYIVAGYGTQPTSGYSIRVNDLYLGTNAVYADVDLLGPEAREDITELPTKNSHQPDAAAGLYKSCLTVIKKCIKGNGHT